MPWVIEVLMNQSFDQQTTIWYGMENLVLHIPNIVTEWCGDKSIIVLFSELSVYVFKHYIIWLKILIKYYMAWTSSLTNQKNMVFFDKLPLETNNDLCFSCHHQIIISLSTKKSILRVYELPYELLHKNCWNCWN